jgi:hypothetical protein
MRVKSGLHVSPPIFRGQADRSWGLQTTLERAGGQLSVKGYHDLIFAAKPQIESHTSQAFDVLSPPAFSDWIEKQSAFGLFDFPAYEYLVYLRHHGFPSPLLDWSASPYIAAFFAFRDAHRSERVAVYCYLEYVGKIKGGWTGDPHIRVRGPYVKTHRRHFWQQAEYTICIRKEGTDWHYAAHDDAVIGDRFEEEKLWVITFPSTARQLVLTELDRYNLNAYSLFGTEDALAETVAFREMHSLRYGA